MGGEKHRLTLMKRLEEKFLLDPSPHPGFRNNKNNFEAEFGDDAKTAPPPNKNKFKNLSLALMKKIAQLERRESDSSYLSTFRAGRL